MTSKQAQDRADVAMEAVRDGEAGATARTTSWRPFLTTLGLTATTAIVGCADTREALNPSRFVDQLESVIASIDGDNVSPRAPASAPAATLSPVETVNLAGAAGRSTLSERPPNARPGECYVRVNEQSRYRTVTERVLEEPADERVVADAATYRTVTERVLIQAAGRREVVVPATYRTITEEVAVDSAGRDVFTRAARFETDNKAASSTSYSTWVARDNVARVIGGDGRRGPHGRVVGDQKTFMNGQEMWLVEVFRTKSDVQSESRANASRASFSNQFAPTQRTRLRTRRVLEKPATTRIEDVPARYALVTRRVLDRPATTRREVTPARYKTVTRQVLDTPGQSGWTAVLCERDASRETVRSLQVALKERGYYRGDVDGVYGPLTAEAVRRFQKTNDVVTLESLRTLGVEI